jgi:hypothetical protein
LVSWEDDELGVKRELSALEEVFNELYCFNTETWMIPSVESHLKLMSKALGFVEEHGGADSLLIRYYGGHASVTNSRQTQWLW